MCGVAGQFQLQSFDVERALERIAHRGPDARGLCEHDGVVHGHVRLSVLDLSSASDQPFRYGGGVLSYNGELWNFAQLREELAALGCSFRTTGDTEVVAAALATWGEAALPRFEGMFALAWSHGAVRLLARDRYGKIPLYVLRKGPGFAWASERKAWGLGRGAGASPLPPATCLDLTTGQLRRYYDPAAEQRPVGDVLALLSQGVTRRLVADAPLCVLISGGLDSSLILALAQRVRPDVVAYTAKLSERASDLHAARKLCSELGVPLTEVPVSAPTSADLEAAVLAIEIPSKAQTEIAALCLPLARRIAADGFKVCLSGEASDELFGGYGNMAIAASQPGADWRQIRLGQLDKMARGNFVRCNKAFMAAGVECRLPFMERELVERVLSMPKSECPPGKAALKRAAHGVVPPWVIARTKDTFQGSSGMADACARVIAEPTRFYNATARRAFGGTVTA
jgi:asparagine synthase (glutamine-hydrolysing)